MTMRETWPTGFQNEGRAEAVTMETNRWHEFYTLWGACLIAWQKRPFLLHKVFLPGCRPGKQPVPTGPDSEVDGRVRFLAGQLQRFFEGSKPREIPEAWLAWEQRTAREQTVLRMVRRIPYGTTRSYGEIAVIAGVPGGARFVGNTMAKNPFPIIVPCHRVVRADSSAGGFTAGTDMKERMIAIEKGH